MTNTTPQTPANQADKALIIAEVVILQARGKAVKALIEQRKARLLLLMNHDGKRVELYDIPKDPTELDNVAVQNPDVVRRLSAKLLHWQGTLPPSPVEASAGSNAYPWPKKK